MLYLLIESSRTKSHRQAYLKKNVELSLFIHMTGEKKSLTSVIQSQNVYLWEYCISHSVYLFWGFILSA